MVKTKQKEQAEYEKKQKNTAKKQLKRFSKKAKKAWNSAKPHLKKIGGTPDMWNEMLSDPNKPKNVMAQNQNGKNPKKKNCKKGGKTQSQNINSLLGIK